VDSGHDAISVFISYARLDAGIADRLVADLEAKGISVTIDRRDLPYGEEWQSELAGFIHGADTVVWLVSSNSLASRWCNWELGEVQRTSKRLIPLRVADVAPEELPEALGRIHLLPAEGTYDPALHLDALVTTLNTDHRWIKDHTRLAGDAATWLAAGRSRDLLLRGRALADAEAWRDRRPASAPPVSPETLDLILESRRGATGRLRQLSGVAVAVALALAVLAVVAVLQRNDAEAQRASALSAQALAEEQRTVADQERQRAEQEAANAEAARKQAEAETVRAEAALAEAEVARAQADEQRVRAEQEARRAEIAAENSDIRRGIAEARVTLSSDPTGALRLATATARRNLATASAGTTPVLIDVLGGMFDALDAGRYAGRYWAAGSTGISFVSAIVPQPVAAGAPRLLIASDEDVRLLDQATGTLLAPPLVGPDLMPAYPNAVVLQPSGDSPWLAVASGRSFNNRPISGAPVEQIGLLSPAVTIYDYDGRELSRLLDDNPAPFLSLTQVRYWESSAPEVLLAGDQQGSIFLIDVATLAASQVIAGKGLPVTGLDAAVTDEDVNLIVTYGDQPTVPLPDGARAQPHTADELQVAFAAAFGKPHATAMPLGDAASPYTCLERVSSEVIVCTSSGAEIWEHGWFSQGELTPARLVSSLAAGGRATAIAYAPDFRLIALGNANGEIRIVGRGDEVLYPVLRQAGAVDAVAFIDGGRTLISAGEHLSKWDLSDLPGDTAGTEQETPLAMTPNARFSVVERSTGTKGENTIAVVDREGSTLFEHDSSDEVRPNDVTLSADGRYVAWDEQDAVVVHEVAGGGENSFRIDFGTAEVQSIALSVDGRHLLAATRIAGESSTVMGEWKLWLYRLAEPLADSQLFREWTAESANVPQAFVALPGATGEIFAIGDNSARVATVDSAGEIVWQSDPMVLGASGQIGISHLAVSGDGKQLIAVAGGSYNDGLLSAWSLPDHAISAPVADTRLTINGVATTADGSLVAVIASADYEQALLLYDRATMGQIAHLNLLDRQSLANVWFSDNTTVAARHSYGGGVAVWDFGLERGTAMASPRLRAADAGDAYDRLLEKAGAARGAAALAAYKEVALLEPGSYDAWFEIGRLAYDEATGEGDKDEARAAYDRALAIDPYAHWGYWHRGRLGYFTGDYDRAVDDYARAMQLSSRFFLADMMFEFSYAARLRAPYEPAAMHAYSLTAAKRWPEAVAALQKLVTTYRGTARDYRLLSVSLSWLDQYQAALVALEQSVKRLEAEQPVYAILDDFAHIADTLIERNRLICVYSLDAAGLTAQPATVRTWLEKARDACKRVIAEDPGFGDTADILADIEKQIAAL
jgi:tetratricopeptide (TPR) repeat protein